MNAPDLTIAEWRAIVESLEYFLKRWPAEDNRQVMESAHSKIVRKLLEGR